MNEENKALLTNRSYDILKSIAQLWLPGLGALYAALAVLWGLPYGFEVVGTITALDVFLGGLLGLSNIKYNAGDAQYDGAIIMDDSDPETDRWSLEVDNLDDLPAKNSISLVVRKPGDNIS